MDLYRELWSRFGGRPWTYIARDIYHKVEYLVLVTVLLAGYVIGRNEMVSWRWFLALLGAYSCGYIHGHFFWGKEYVPGQKAEEPK
jgi:hypothetical protein